MSGFCHTNIKAASTQSVLRHVIICLNPYTVRLMLLLVTYRRQRHNVPAGRIRLDYSDWLQIPLDPGGL